MTREEGSMSLYVLADEYRAAAEALADLELPAQAVQDTLEGLSGALEQKATNVAMFARNLEATAEAIKAAEADMAARRKALETRARAIRYYLQTNMAKVGITRIESPYFTLAIQANPASVVVEDEDMIPSQLMRVPEPTPPVPDKKAIADLLKSGASVPGCRLDRTTRLVIK